MDDAGHLYRPCGNALRNRFFSVRKARLHPIDVLPCFSPARHIWSKRRGMSRFSLAGLAFWLAFI
jgi:hypothetical protein